MKTRHAILAAALSALLSSAAPARGPEIAITFDDLPVHGPIPADETPVAVADRVIAALKAAKVRNVYGFINAAQSEVHPGSDQVLIRWRAAGLPLGNHTWSHRNLNDISVADYEAEIVSNEPILQRLAGRTDWRWFRYPFLSEGSDPAKRVEIRRFLAARGYRIAAVTMDFGDYQWNGPYARCKAAGDQAAIGRMEAMYLDAARQSIAFHRSLSKALYGRDVPYVLLMHIGAFDARMLPRLLDLYRTSGFRFISLPQAERDPSYRADVDPSLPPGPQNLEGRAAAKGIPFPQRTDFGPLLDGLCQGGSPGR